MIFFYSSLMNHDHIASIKHKKQLWSYVLYWARYALHWVRKNITWHKNRCVIRNMILNFLEQHQHGNKLGVYLSFFIVVSEYNGFVLCINFLRAFPRHLRFCVQFPCPFISLLYRKKKKTIEGERNESTILSHVG